MNKKIPKYKVGDIVVIVMYSTVGTVTNVHQIDQHYLYEVNHSEILYFENAIQLYSEYNGKVIDSEKIEIEFQYHIGDIVQVKGYDEELFKVVGFRTEIWRYTEDGWEDIIYELMRINDGEWLEASEEELVFVMGKKQAGTFVQQLSLMHIVSPESKTMDQLLAKEKLPKQEPAARKAKRSKRDIVDELLDIYNDYLSLYEIFGDAEYKEMMDFIIDSLNKYTKDH
ncbi:hypothetical protein RFW18_08265 [Metabacillus idriensis]|nr:hypothetical protein [Metabacillus idriensis]MDR0137743.1 hypothetical protein [Metabacillus idriensis]